MSSRRLLLFLVESIDYAASVSTVDSRLVLATPSQSPKPFEWLVSVSRERKKWPFHAMHPLLWYVFYTRASISITKRAKDAKQSQPQNKVQAQAMCGWLGTWNDRNEKKKKMELTTKPPLKMKLLFHLVVSLGFSPHTRTPRHANMQTASPSHNRRPPETEGKGKRPIQKCWQFSHAQCTCIFH